MRMIVAVDDRWGIGKNGDLLESIPEDMKYYRSTTRSKVMLMGYNTLISLPGSKPQPGRLNFVLADIAGLKVSGGVVCDSMDMLLRMAADFDGDDVFVIGGGSIYRQLLPYCERAHITKMRFDGEADTYIPNLDEMDEWSVESQTEVSEWEGIKYSFAVYRNASPKALPAAAGRSSDMSAYFKKKDEITAEILDTDDAGYMAELGELLRAYFRPLADGFGADDVREFLKSGTSFESYLRKGRYIAAVEDISALSDKYDKDGKLPRKTVRINKENFEEYILE